MRYTDPIAKSKTDTEYVGGIIFKQLVEEGTIVDFNENSGLHHLDHLRGDSLMKILTVSMIRQIMSLWYWTSPVIWLTQTT